MASYILTLVDQPIGFVDQWQLRHFPFDQLPGKAVQMGVYQLRSMPSA